MSAKKNQSISWHTRYLYVLQNTLPCFASKFFSLIHFLWCSEQMDNRKNDRFKEEQGKAQNHNINFGWKVKIIIFYYYLQPSSNKFTTRQSSTWTSWNFAWMKAVVQHSMGYDRTSCYSCDWFYSCQKYAKRVAYHRKVNLLFKWSQDDNFIHYFSWGYFLKPLWLSLSTEYLSSLSTISHSHGIHQTHKRGDNTACVLRF